jgi:hemerythrin-like domain-containing protein
MINEHKAIRKQLHSANTITELNLLATLVNDHIRFEERVLFPHAEKLLSQQQLVQIEEGLKENPSSCPAWHDEFWLS